MSHFTLLLGGLMLVFMCASGYGQVRVPAEPPGVDWKSAAFDSVVVHENRDAFDVNVTSRATIDAAGRFTATRVSVMQLIITAFSVRADHVIDDPAWARRDRFDISAIAPENFDPASTRAMLRTLLQERFGLITKRETRRVPAYALERDGKRPLGRGIEPASVKCDQAPMASSTATGVPRRGGCDGASGYGGGWIFVRHATIASLLTFLTSAVGRPIVDRTSLKGLYDIDVKWSPEPGSGFPFEIAGSPDQGGGASVFTAVKEQLGLTLRPTTAELDALVVVRLEHPRAD